MYAGIVYILIQRVVRLNFQRAFQLCRTCVHVCARSSCLVYINEVSCLFHACHNDCMSSVFVKCCGDVGLWMLGMVYGRSAR